MESLDMATNPGSIGRLPADGEIVAATDEIEGQPHLVIADIARDDAWISVSEADAASLSEWK
ncbi:hypothetical protein SAMN05443661_16512 [Natronobacterium gregoryi]|uniref:Uncharacterized protein n=3 Tax=Natronobacterium gregoryi TaxID=44930 RepID=L0AFW3_NATGS|nr:hypothetical protein Natgr_1095 [Natronobacterium gregoryi SP2]PLK18312.1 hypothetical protein CYV19_18175 [Natronobacterium gregoryi SP2]SFJ72154.1 hypothetical protein SAMN05443661_16512 [Natronobacterium gregoryi]